MVRHRYLITLGALLLLTIPVMAQRGGPRGGYYSRGGSSFGFGITLGSPSSGLSFGYGTGGYGSFGAIGVPGRPYYGGLPYGGGYYGGYRGPYGGTYYPTPNYYVPRTYILPQPYIAPQPYIVPTPTYIVPRTTVVPSTPAPVTPSEMGILITELKPDGTAKAAGLRQGDVILSVDGKRIQSFEELRAALSVENKKQAKVEFIDGSNNQIDSKEVAIVDSKMGITIEEVPLKRE